MAIDLHTDVRSELLQHPIYSQMNSAERVRVLMKHHAFAVWDFMTLLKKLQQVVTCVDVPWIPAANANYARFINEIVLGEESDEDGEGGYISHFELYIKAMRETGADSGPVERFVNRVREKVDPIVALQNIEIPATASKFVTHTLRIAMYGKPHEVAASFFYGREELIPDLFQLLLDEVESSGMKADGLKYYLKRHIELDGDEHGPLAEKLLNSLCGGDPEKIAEANAVAESSLRARIRLWDGVLEEIREKGV